MAAKPEVADTDAAHFLSEEGSLNAGCFVDTDGASGPNVAVLGCKNSQRIRSVVVY